MAHIVTYPKYDIPLSALTTCLQTTATTAAGYLLAYSSYFKVCAHSWSLARFSIVASIVDQCFKSFLPEKKLRHLSLILAPLSAYAFTRAIGQGLNMRTALIFGAIYDVSVLLTEYLELYPKPH